MTDAFYYSGRMVEQRDIDFARQKTNNGSLSNSMGDYRQHEDKIFYWTMAAIVIHVIHVIIRSLRSGRK